MNQPMQQPRPMPVMSRHSETKRNPLDDARDHASRGAEAFALMERDLKAANDTRDEALRDNDLLRAEVSRLTELADHQRKDHSQALSEVTHILTVRAENAEEQRDIYMRWAAEMTGQLKFLDAMATGHAQTISTALARAIEAAKSGAFALPHEIKAEVQQAPEGEDQHQPEGDKELAEIIGLIGLGGEAIPPPAPSFLRRGTRDDAF